MSGAARAARPQGVAAAARGGARDRGESRANGVFSGPFHAYRGDEPVPVRLSGRPPPPLPVRATAGPARRQQNLRPSSGLDRSRRRGSAGGGLTTRDRARGEPSRAIRERVVTARARQRRRFEMVEPTLNAGMESALLREHCALDRKAGKLFEAAIQKSCLSARGCDRVLRVSRTIAEAGSGARGGGPSVSVCLRLIFARGNFGFSAVFGLC